jgi:hypothetical protein
MVINEYDFENLFYYIRQRGFKFLKRHRLYDTKLKTLIDAELITEVFGIPISAKSIEFFHNQQLVNVNNFDVQNNQFVEVHKDFEHLFLKADEFFKKTIYVINQ